MFMCTSWPQTLGPSASVYFSQMTQGQTVRRHDLIIWVGGCTTKVNISHLCENELFIIKTTSITTLSARTPAGKVYVVCASVQFSIRALNEEGWESHLPRWEEEAERGGGGRFKDSISTSLLYAKTPTLTDSPFQPAYLDFVLGLSVYHWRRAWFERASGNNKVGDSGGKKEEENDRGKERERKEAPQWHLKR